jgi:hypothetical protein
MRCLGGQGLINDFALRNRSCSLGRIGTKVALRRHGVGRKHDDTIIIIVVEVAVVLAS